MNISARLYEVILILSFVALWLAIQIPKEAEHIIGYFLILSIGVGHGANDLKIYFKNKKLSVKSSIKFISLYSFAVIAGFAAFFVIPDIVLTIFLIISGFHFGQEHFERYSLPNSIRNNIFFTAYGFTIIITILYIHSDLSLEILNDLITYLINKKDLKIVLLASSGVTVLSSIICLRKINFSSIAKELLYLFVFYFIFSNSSLIWSFAIYFILWHSVPSIHHQITHLYGTVTKKNIIVYIKESLLFWLAALLFLGALYYAFQDKTSLFLSIIVAFLGGITFPHVIVMNKINH